MNETYSFSSGKTYVSDEYGVITESEGCIKVLRKF